MLSLIAQHSSAPITSPSRNTTIMSPSTTMMHVVEPSSLQVDYDVNITDLYQAICNCDWDLAVESVRKNPKEARTWVVRHYADDLSEEKEIMWRFLPIHSACARDPPAFVISALLKAYPDGAHCVDDQGMYALHYACGNQASREVIRLLLVANSMAAKCADPRGMLPIHYLACWGPSSVSIIDMVMVANRDVGKAQDNDGNTPLDLAMEGDYPERDQVVAVLKRWLEKSSRSNHATPPASLSTPSRMTKTLPTFTHETHPADEQTQHGTTTTPQQDNHNDNVDKDDPAKTSSRLSVNTTSEDQVEVNIMLSPLSQVDHENENAIVISPRRGEEKDSSAANNNNSSSTGVSPRTVSRLRQEVSKLRTEKNESEAFWQEKLKTSVKVLDAKCDEMVHQVEELKLALQEANTKIVTLEQESAEKDQIVVDTESQLSDALERIQGIEQENEELKHHVEALELDNSKLSKVADTRNDRLYTLTASIESMMERQEMIMQAVNEKNAQLTEASQARRQNLKMLFDMEQEFMEAVMGSADEMPEFEKQMKEMEGLTAIIETMKE